MASHSLYRKWRSQTFSDLIGQEPVVRTLLNAVREGRLAHAYLFCGPRGTGKTSAARLLAKAVNCANPHDGEPCNECLSCREITAGTSPDVIEIDAASNTGVDNIRDLRETVNLLTTGGRYRVLVIDEVHMLSTQAFNALLKTLEEPPPHVIFVLATTEAHKVLPTIVSRCQRFDFRRHTIRNIIARLGQVAEGEGLALEPAAAELLARAAQGGMRDALSLLDQAMAFCGTQVDAETVRRMLGLADPGLLRTLILCVAENRAADGLHLINELVGNGADLRQLNSQLAEEWRALVLARAGADVATLMDRTDEDARELAELASRFSLEALTACARVFARNETPARGLPVPQLALELSFLECIAIQANGGSAAAAAATVAQPSPAERMPEVTRRAPTAAPSPAPTTPAAAVAPSGP
ncbi:MAG TPA: DNA polymerase III subunit gamma/tau, partial [Ktedonobacterales bacterium]|nr:DNA polymerase III subunit gamma/tau [Ktedonobacterales bacterium]